MIQEGVIAAPGRWSYCPMRLSSMPSAGRRRRHDTGTPLTPGRTTASARSPSPLRSSYMVPLRSAWSVTVVSAVALLLPTSGSVSSAVTTAVLLMFPAAAGAVTRIVISAAVAPAESDAAGAGHGSGGFTATPPGAAGALIDDTGRQGVRNHQVGGRRRPVVGDGQGIGQGLAFEDGVRKVGLGNRQVGHRSSRWCRW